MALTHIIPKAHATAVVVSKKDEEMWEIERSHVKLGKQLGAGNYGEVWRATYDKKTVAVKTVKEDSYQQVSMGIEEFMREAQVMKKMNHPNLVQLVGVCSKELPMYIITEYCAHGDLLTFLRSHPKDINQKAMYVTLPPPVFSYSGGKKVGYNATALL